MQLSTFDDVMIPRLNACCGWLQMEDFLPIVLPSSIIQLKMLLVNSIVILLHSDAHNISNYYKVYRFVNLPVTS